jgi:hypothetical protein
MRTNCNDMPVSPGWACCRDKCKHAYNGQGTEVCHKCGGAKCPPQGGDG